jgi:hypothetical protein
MAARISAAFKIIPGREIPDVHGSDGTKLELGPRPYVEAHWWAALRQVRVRIARAGGTQTGRPRGAMRLERCAIGVDTFAEAVTVRLPTGS